MLQRLKGQDCSADFAGFAVPHQFDFALVGKQEEAILFRQRLALLDQLDEVALLGVGEVVFFRIVRSRHVSAITLSLTLF